MSAATLRRLSPLRSVCALFRAAFDAHVTHLDLRDLPTSAFLPPLLPRLHNLTSLALPAAALAAPLHQCWADFCRATDAHVQHLMLVGSGVVDAKVAELIATRFAPSLERLTTDSDPFLSAVAARPAAVRELQLHMDAIPAERLLAFSAATSLRLLYRTHFPDNLTVSVPPGAADVHLRVNRLHCSRFEALARIPGLRRVALFDAHVDGTDARGMDNLAQCTALEHITFEWARGLNGHDVARLAQAMGARLKKLLIWNCEDVTDEALVALQCYCPSAEVELYFARDQFSPRALALLGDRVSWGSSAF